jgi:parallel beta-helix repeat protein
MTDASPLTYTVATVTAGADQTVGTNSTGDTYYIDSIGGSDSNVGTSTNQAWKTIAKVNGSTFVPGDHIVFKRGDTWREQLTIPSSGTANDPITFDAYGTGASPTISGANTVTGWSHYSGNIYVANVGSIAMPTQLYMDGTFYDMAHYPNSGFLTATNDSSDNTSVIDSNLALTSDQIVGATIATKPLSWFISTTTVASYDSSTHTITTLAPVDSQSPSQKMTAGYSFYLQNKLWMLDSPGEWYYDSSSGNLYLWTAGSDDPNSHTVEISNRSSSIVDDGNNYVTIQNLATADANHFDVSISNANNVALNGLDISGGVNGIYSNNISYSTIENSSILDTLAEGMLINGNNIDISNNSTDNAGNVGVSPQYSHGSVYLNGWNSIIDANTIDNSGFNGIAFSPQNTIENNVINNSCLVLDDCGGLYTFNGDNSNYAGSSIIGNIVTNSIGNFAGTPVTNTQANGIYLDDLSRGFTVKNNITYNTDLGFYIHSGHANTLTGNSAYGARVAGLLISEQGSLPGEMAGTVHDNVITGNTFEMTATSSLIYGIANGVTDYYSQFGSYFGQLGSTANFGTFNNNLYCHPNTSYTVVNDNVEYTLSAWQAFSGQDSNSTDTATYCEYPSVSTHAASSVLSSSATLNGVAGFWSGDMHQEGFEYSTDPTMKNVITTTTLNGQIGVTPFSQTLTDLVPNTTYYFRAYAVNSLGTSTGSILSFTTSTTVAPTIITPTGSGPTGSRSSSGGFISASALANILMPGTTTTAYLNSLNISLVPGCPTGFTCTPKPLASSTLAYRFTRTLRLGMTGNDVKQLQIFLNAHGLNVSKKGAGSPGHETTLFGPATKAALMRFQLAHKKETLDPQGLKKPTGFFGIDTMKTVNAMMRQ